MKQLFMDVKNGKPILMDVPAPVCKKDGIVVETLYSLVSAGTERMLLEFGRKGLLAKAKERPDQLKKVLDKIRTDGIATALSAAFRKLGEPLPLGYSLMGRVLETGNLAQEFSAGQLVACAGLSATHAEVCYVPKNLAVPLPPGFEDPRQAAFVALGAIAMHGIRQAEVKFGDWVAVIGLGLLGQIAVRIAKAAGCRVIGIDIDPSREALAEGYLDAFILSDNDTAPCSVQSLTGKGVDAVIITAAAHSNQPVELAAEIARDRAIVSMVGVTEMNLPRRPFYQKELTFRLSRSYGPGRYDANYEEKGFDYPIGYVKWTERRNMEEFIRLLGTGAISLKELITHQVEIGQAEKAYELITDNPNKEKVVGVLLSYPERTAKTERILAYPSSSKARRKVEGRIGVGLIGGGNFARSVILPNMAKIPEYEFIGLATTYGTSAGVVLKGHPFRYATTEYRKLLEDPEIDLVVIATPHNTHAPLAIEALGAGKHVYVEKPLAITMEQLDAVKEAYDRNHQHLFVGFNRRHSPFAKFLKEKLETDKYPCMIQYTVNAGAIPEEHWTQDPEVGGGRIVGEACHFIDFCMFLTGSTPVSVHTTWLKEPDGRQSKDNANISLGFENGSTASILYSSAGTKTFPKEIVTVFCNGKVGELENYLLAETHSSSGKSKMRKMCQEKGFKQEYEWMAEVLGKTERDLTDSIFLVSEWAIKTATSGK